MQTVAYNGARTVVDGKYIGLIKIRLYILTYNLASKVQIF